MTTPRKDAALPPCQWRDQNMWCRRGLNSPALEADMPPGTKTNSPAVANAGGSVAQPPASGAEIVDAGAAEGRCCACDGAPADLPRWDAEAKVLVFRGWIVKQFRRPAPMQEAIFDAFQEANWAVRMDDPLRPTPGTLPKEHLHATIRSLNQHQECPILRFLGDGSGERILWVGICRMIRLRQGRPPPQRSP